MCGLVGMAGDMLFKHRAAFKTMLFFNSLRGSDSTGVSVFNADANTVKTKKATVPGFEFVATEGFDGFLGLPRGVWMGHGRARTVGAVSRMNAHPFEIRDEEDCISMFGAHNGTLRNQWAIEKLLDGQKFGTDSEALINLISKLGPQEALAEADGAWALSWWHYETSSINLIRNKERPLYYAMTEDEQVLVWASEPWMIRVACERENVALAKDSRTFAAVWGLPEDTLFTWSIPEGRNKEFASPVRKGGVVGKIIPPAPIFPFKAAAGEDDVSKTEEDDAKALESLGTTSNAKKLVGFEGELVDAQFVEEMKKSGCDWCGDVITDTAFSWMDDYSLACRACLRGEHVVVDVKTGTITNVEDLIIVEKKGSRR